MTKGPYGPSTPSTGTRTIRDTSGTMLRGTLQATVLRLAESTRAGIRGLAAPRSRSTAVRTEKGRTVATTLATPWAG